MTSKPIDWTAIETAYITGSEGLRALASRFSVSRTEINRKSKQCEWVRKRKEYRTEVVANAVRNSLRAREDEIADIIEGAELVNRRALELLRDEDCLAALMSTRQPGRELEALSRALANVDELSRKCRGILEPRDAERLKLDREKFETEIAQKRDEHKDQEIKVVFSAGLEEYSE